MHKLTLFFLVITTTLSAQPFQLEDILSTPYTSELTASPHDNAIAWVANEQGIRNIWMAYSSFFDPRKLTDYRDDDGQTITDLTFTPDRRSIIFQYGGNANRNGEFPNPTSDPNGVNRAIMQVSTKGGRPFRLAYGSNPVISPDGKRMLYSFKGQIWVKDLENFKTPGQQLFKARGSLSDFSWSNDGEKVLFLSNRGTHNLVGIYDTQLRTVQWLAPGVGRDARPIWSPDNRRIAFIRTPGKRKGELFDLTGANPFSIWVVDVATGAAGIIWASPNNRAGGFAQYYPEHPLRWAGNDDLVFYSEHEGWIHIYKLNIESRRVTDLTPGDCEAEQSSVSRDGRWLYVSHNCLDIDGRQLSRIDIRTGKSTILTDTDVLATHPVAIQDSDWIAFRQATYNTPLRLQSPALVVRRPKRYFPSDYRPAFRTASRSNPASLLITQQMARRYMPSFFIPKTCVLASGARLLFLCMAAPFDRCCPAGIIADIMPMPTL
jgi:Tol biopolymer transport system component